VSATSNAPVSVAAPQHERAHKVGAGADRHAALGNHGRHPHHMDAAAGAGRVRTDRRSARKTLGPPRPPNPGHSAARTGRRRQRRSSRRAYQRRYINLNGAIAACPRARRSNRSAAIAPSSGRPLHRQRRNRFGPSAFEAIGCHTCNKAAPSMRGFSPPLTASKPAPFPGPIGYGARWTAAFMHW